nr:uncharacterized protein LOC114925000 [Arachis hypogaea]
MLLHFLCRGLAVNKKETLGSKGGRKTDRERRSATHSYLTISLTHTNCSLTHSVSVTTLLSLSHRFTVIHSLLPSPSSKGQNLSFLSRRPSKPHDIHQRRLAAASFSVWSLSAAACVRLRHLQPLHRCSWPSASRHTSSFSVSAHPWLQWSLSFCWRHEDEGVVILRVMKNWEYMIYIIWRIGQKKNIMVQIYTYTMPMFPLIC